MLTRTNSEKEENIGDLYEAAIECNWEGGLEPLVRLLYAIQVQGATVDMRQLTITPGKAKNQLKGSFKVYFAFTRSEADKEPSGEG